MNETMNEWMQLFEKLCLNRFLTDKQFRNFFKFLNQNFLTLVLMFFSNSCPSIVRKIHPLFLSLNSGPILLHSLSLVISHSLTLSLLLSLSVSVYLFISLSLSLFLPLYLFISLSLIGVFPVKLTFLRSSHVRQLAYQMLKSYDGNCLQSQRCEKQETEVKKDEICHFSTLSV